MEAAESNNESQSLVDRIRGARDRVQRAEQSKRADRRAQARSEGMSGDNEQSETVQEARGLASDAKELISTEFGVDEDDAKQIISRGSDILSAAGDRIDQLDTDGDGDTDILSRIEDGVEANQGRGSARQQRGVEPPVGDIEDDFEEVAANGVEAEIDLDFPIEDDL